MHCEEIDAVTFDLDGTLIEYERSPGEVLQRAADNVGMERIFPVEEYNARYDEFANRYDSQRRLRAECFATLAAEHGADPEDGRALAAAFAEERDQSRVEFLPGAERALAAASERYRTAVVTNGAADAQRTKLETLGIDATVETVVVGGADAPPKPATAPFEQALSALGVDPASAVHVGDSPETDVAGASAVGAASILIGTGSNSSDPTARYGSVAGLLDCPLFRQATG